VRALAAAAALLLCGAAAVPEPAATSAHGEAIYRQGRLPSGELLRGERQGALPLQGQDAACVQCHRRSGLGMVEGKIVIPPISGHFLFRPGHRISRGDPVHEGGTHLLPTPPDRAAYDEAALARAIREGVGADGRPLHYLMPRYDLDDAAMRDLIAYLGRLSSGRVPGATDTVLHFATIVTPDADPVARDGMLNVLEQYFEEKNSRWIGGNATPLLQGGRPIEIRTQRRWELHVWQLTGSADTWETQLDERLRHEPVFAVISGIAGATWEPVHRFCERQAVPCLLPNVDRPVVDPEGFYSVYFSQGVLLEAQLVAARLGPARSDGTNDRRIVQVFRQDDIGAAAAARLRETLPRDAVPVDRALEHGAGPKQLAHALTDTKAGDTLVLWLRPADLAALPGPASGLAAVYASGLMGGLEQAPLTAQWRELTRITYPYALPDERSLRLNYPLGWFRLRRIPVVDERVQVDTYIACSVLLETLASMLDEFVRDFLVERVEVMLDSRIVNGYYTRLGLAPAQRFASKGGYLVRFLDPTGPRIAADGDWIVP
jgi:cytochrome c